MQRRTAHAPDEQTRRQAGKMALLFYFRECLNRDGYGHAHSCAPAAMPCHVRLGLKASTRMYTCTPVKSVISMAQLQHPPRLESVSGKAEHVLRITACVVGKLNDIMGSLPCSDLQIRASRYTLKGSACRSEQRPAATSLGARH